MALFKRPNPLDAGHIDGQHPETPERLPAHTSDVTSSPSGSATEAELGGRPAFLFEAGDLSAITLDSSGQNLPRVDSSAWQLKRYLTLGTRDEGSLGVDLEPVVHGICSRGYYLWRKGASADSAGAPP
jgi:hypothetical protein